MPFFGLGRRKNHDILGIYFARLGNSRSRSFNFEKTLPKTCFLSLSADTYSDHVVSPIAEGVEFLPFFGLGRRKNHDILGIYFVRNNCVFSDALEPVQNKIPKKITFLGNFLGYIFHHVSFSWLCFYTVLSGWSTTSGWFFRTAFFRTPKNGAFWLQRSLCGARIPYLSANNRLESRISRDQHIQQFLKCTPISSPLFRRKWPTQVGTLGTLCWG